MEPDHLWKAYLYHLQQNAPKAKAVPCEKPKNSKSEFYGKEFHGLISRDEAAVLLGKEDGNYLVRERVQARGQYALSIRFSGSVKHYKLNYNGQHYVSDMKYFDNIQDLVNDGLITMYIQKNAGSYIDFMSQASYATSPHMTLNTMKKNTLGRNHNAQIDLLNDSVQSNDHSVENIRQYEKSHSFKTATFRGLPFCEFCGNFMWGLIAQGVKCEDCGVKAHKKCSEKLPSDCCPDLTCVNGVFGVDLTTLVKAHQMLRPVIVDKCVNEIERRGLRCEGIYRVSASNDHLETLKLVIEKDPSEADLSHSICDDIHVVAGVLKLFFRLLPIPLIPYDNYWRFVSSVVEDDSKSTCNNLKEAVQSLPPAHYHTLKFLIGHLRRVASVSHINLMTANNLSRVFSPTLLKPAEYISQLPNLQKETAVLECLIEYHSQIFEI